MVTRLLFHRQHPFFVPWFDILRPLRRNRQGNNFRQRTLMPVPPFSSSGMPQNPWRMAQHRLVPPRRSIWMRLEGATVANNGQDLFHGHKSFTRNSNKQFLTNSYDDEGWWALAWIQAYHSTDNPTI